MQIENIKKIGPKSTKLLNKLNIYTTDDLASYYPYKYEFLYPKKLEDAVNSENFYTLATVVSTPSISYIRSNLNRLTFKCMCSNKLIKVTIFNRAFLKQNITINKKLLLYGKYEKFKNQFIANDIKFDLNKNILPVYHLTEGLSQNNVSTAINLSLNNYECYDYIPDYLNSKYNFLNKKTALEFIHNPINIKDLKAARLKLIYEELFVFMTKINFLKLNNGIEKGIKRSFNEKDKEIFFKALTFTLTKDQHSAFDDILKDMNSDKKMNRLILGDVGSGKTLTALYAIYINTISNYQSAFMAPTELLAKQHFDTCKNFFNNLDVSIEIITGKMSKKEKDNIKARLLKGEIDLLIGTHSLISDGVIFKSLGLVITDEEHRFGVIQRKNLENKGINPDILYLSATPIPRTYAKIIYKDTDVSIIKTKPTGRKEIITTIVNENNVRKVLKKMLEEIKKGHQIFVVSPLIDNEESDLASVKFLEEKFKVAFKNIAVIQTMHGAMKNEEKHSIMHDFSIGKIDILISTTVVEVGIDVPNATIIAIYNAERFGLATLHQLRGRVGRSKNDSFCYLISSSENNVRLNVMKESNDGFYITEKDFEERKEGDLFGVKQSGEQIFKIASLKNDYQILLQASKDAEEFVTNKKYLNNEFYLNTYENIKKLT